MKSSASEPGLIAKITSHKFSATQRHWITYFGYDKSTPLAVTYFFLLLCSIQCIVSSVFTSFFLNVVVL